MNKDLKPFIEFIVGWLLLSLVIAVPIMMVFNACVIYTMSSVYSEITLFQAWGLALLPAMGIVIFQKI